MALNDKFQLTNYGTEVQKAIDDALITIPKDLALKAYRDEVLTKNQTVPYTPTSLYHPATKLYVDNASSILDNKLDNEIERAKEAERILNIKPVLLYNSTSSIYEYVNLANLDIDTNALVDETAIDAKLAELSLGFFVFYRVDADTGELIEGKHELGVSPLFVTNDISSVPTTGVSDSDIALTLKDDLTINVYKYNETLSLWELLNTPHIQNGWIFSSTSDEHGYYWFSNTWSLIDMNVDMSQYYTKTATDVMLSNYVTKITLGAMSTLNTNAKTTVVDAINEVKSTADLKDTLPSIDAYSVLANNTNTSAKPLVGIQYNANSADGLTLVQRTVDGRIKAEEAIENNDVTTLLQVNNLITNMDMSPFQLKISGGTANDIIAYSGTAGILNTLTRATTISATAANRVNTKLPTELAVGSYVDNYKPIIVTQGNTNTSVTTTQLTFWVES